MADTAITNLGNLKGRTDENGYLIINARAQSGALNATHGLNARGKMSGSGSLAVEDETAGASSRRTIFAHAPLAVDAGGAIAIADNVISGSPGPLTPLSMLMVAVDENRSLLVSKQTAGTPGPLTNLSNLKCRVDALGRLLVAEG